MHTNQKTYLLFIISCFLFLNACDQQGTSFAKDSAGSERFRVVGEFPMCQMDSIYLYTMDGLEYKKLLSVPVERSGDKSVFKLSGYLPAQGFFLLGQAPNNLTSLILGDEDEIKITGNCMDLRTFAKVENSAINDQFKTVAQQMSQLQQQVSMAEQRLRAQGAQNSAAVEEAQKTFNDIFNQQKAIIEDLKQTHPFLAKVFALNLYKQFDPNNNPQNYRSGLEHFAGELFTHADLQDPDYDYVISLSDNVRQYTQIVFNTNNPLDKKQAQRYLDALLDKMPKGSIAQKNALASALDVLERMRSGAFVDYAERYLSTYETRPEVSKTLQKRIALIREEARLAEQFGIGAIPPDIVLPTPDGQEFKLSSLRGKVVLLDFWASWCRPCRAENPNVVRAYQKYKAQGFDILSVSLDRNREAWTKAIKDDRMTWHHVSDLKFWQSTAAQEYQIKAIPATFLLDREGRIVAKNLRGPALGAKLAEIFANE